MDWLTKLPVIGPWVARLMRTHAWRAYETLGRVHWSRLAAAITFVSFLALFPLITVAAAIGAALLSPSQLHAMQDALTRQVPGISDQLDLNTLVQNAGTVGVVAGALLLFTGIGWIGSMRDCLRAVWELDNADQGNAVVRKLKDGVILFGTGGAVLVSAGASAVGSSAVSWTAGQLGIEDTGWGGALLQGVALALAVLADFLVLLYVLTLLPGVEPPRRRLITAGLIGALGFELLKLLLSGYMRGVASKSMYGAFGVPVALLLWISFTVKLLLYCAAWTATGHADEEEISDVENVVPDPAAASAGSPGTPRPPTGATPLH
ncbi:YihY/virulence factor BrkB family protein [Streptomyces sp. NBC_00963]|uniref:YihY/virulence factor BrkB family protein n=1 Tax=unclassified Streptomyces TaxID=2593676 RepID=UPI0022558B35|nr:YihY/virulence factor BrkB family protein [Streptomyces sp. NBC_01306]MCX4724369.1 YihY/virulence factor BrkB family protein [Streptomyces sp. NBC_01306]WSX44230.1 YihY/virulence factor BrkB family protein [Streptomyces sp. NBC_00963]